MTAPRSAPHAQTADKRPRLDQLLVELGRCESRERAQALILAGAVTVDGQVVRKAGERVRREAELVLRTEELPYVSRGGLKLRQALAFFAVDVRGLAALDVGASTGGFTDCLLQAGAARVCAVDVGYGQLAWKLRNDPRVTVMERVNARFLKPEDLPFRPDLVVCDASFISQTLLLPAMVAAAGPGRRWLITLVKPQFEVEKGQVGKGGVVRDPALHQQAIQRCVAAAEVLGCQVMGVAPSPLLGPAGNSEFLLALRTAAE